MIVNGRELFSIEDIDNYTDKFTDKLTEINNRISQLDSDIVKCEAELDACLEADILEGTASTKKALSNEQSRKENLQSQRNNEILKVNKIKEIMAKGIEDLAVKADKKLRADMAVYNEVVEKEIFRQLGQLREQQEELLLTLQVAHNDVVNKLFSFDEICHLFDLKRYTKSPSNQMFHNNLHMAHRSFPEFGSPLINCNNLQVVEDRIMRARAEANFECNNGKAPEDKIQLPPTKTLRDVDLQAFIDSFKKRK